ncbi:Protein CBG27236 [Caenorhabditis briggsae]|uniref:Protein CBG27236 n=1 Tax=Caenorhabditis briggsae TaxID=6238 RepID=B6IFV8_CAEBR|nr:Protein CBG27236 [Caenorhabditis briggsae]CAR98774.1 Protein CBG27236 [Caenorhabditis briggsae]
MENTKCYKDYVLFETFDRCSHDAFSIGPMSFCNKILKDFNKNSPGILPSCVVDYLEKHQAARQYYLGCDGTLKFEDLEVFNSTDSTN